LERNNKNGMNSQVSFIEDVHIKENDVVNFSLKGKTPEQRVKLLILHDLNNLGWNINFGKKKIEVVPPEFYDKETIRQAMSVKRQEILNTNKQWIDKHIAVAKENLANGYDVMRSKIEPVIEVCKTQKQKDLFRIFRYYWSSPYSDYVGRRIKLLIRDNGLPNKPVIGIAALGSPIIHIPERDNFIGWDKDTRTKNLIYAMDAYIIGALPPYNYLLGGKLVSYILASKEIRTIYENKYEDKITLTEKRKANQLVGIFTTSLYGKSSQYNRLKYHDDLLYQHIGCTKGYGTLHLSKETIQEMVKLLKSKNIEVNHRFGDGPSWIMRVIRSAGDILNFDSNFLLKHSFKRNIYFVPLAKNYKEFLNGEVKYLEFYNYAMHDLVSFWKKRWLENRKQNVNVIANVLAFHQNDFVL
jgi:hypothetical protein